MNLGYTNDAYLLWRVAAIKMTTVVTALTVTCRTAAWSNSARKESKMCYTDVKYQDRWNSFMVTLANRAPHN